MMLLFWASALACEHAIPCGAACDAGDHDACLRWAEIVLDDSRAPWAPTDTGFVETVLACEKEGVRCDVVDGWFRWEDAAWQRAWPDLKRCRAGWDQACEQLHHQLERGWMPPGRGESDARTEADALWRALCREGEWVACSRSPDEDQRASAVERMRGCRTDATTAELWACHRAAPVLWERGGEGREVVRRFMKDLRRACAQGSTSACEWLGTTHVADLPPNARQVGWEGADFHFVRSCKGRCRDAALWGWERIGRMDPSASLFLKQLCDAGESLACVPERNFPRCLEKRDGRACLDTARAEAITIPYDRGLEELLEVGCEVGNADVCALRDRLIEKPHSCSSFAACLDACSRGERGACYRTTWWGGLRDVDARLEAPCRAGDDLACSTMFGLQSRFAKDLADELCAGGRPYACLVAGDQTRLKELSEPACASGVSDACLWPWIVYRGPHRVSGDDSNDWELVGDGAQMELERLGAACVEAGGSPCYELISAAHGFRTVDIWPFIGDPILFGPGPRFALARFDEVPLRAFLERAIDAAAARCSDDPGRCAGWSSLVHGVGRLAAEKGEPWGEMHQRHERRLCREQPDLCGPEAP